MMQADVLVSAPSISSNSSIGDGGVDGETLRGLADDLESLTVAQQAARPSLDGLDLPSLGGAKGTGPRLFCGHVPKEVNDEMVRQHFSKWGTVHDVYFPRHKKTLKRRPFCFVTFANKEDAQRALTESGLEIAGVAIKNLTMVEDRDKYYTNKHATARQALLQALKQLGPGSGGAPPAGAAAQQGGSPPTASPLPSAAAAAQHTGGMSSEQLSNLAAMMALEGVPMDVVLQTLGLPPAAVDPLAALPPGSSGLAGIDTALLAQALASSGMSSSSAFEALARGSFDLRNSYDLHGSFDLRSSLDLASAVRSARASLDLSSLAAAAAAQGLYDGSSSGASMTRMHTTDSRSTMTSADTWSNAPSARNSLDPSGLMPVTAGFLASGASSLGSLQTRLSLDAALQMQHQQQQQQQAAMIANQMRLASANQMQQQQQQQQAGGYGMPPLPHGGGGQQNMSAALHSSFYQPAAGNMPLPASQQDATVQHSMQTVMSSGLYGGPPPLPPTTRHSMHEFSGSAGRRYNDGHGNGMQYADGGWGSHMAPQHAQQQQQQHGTLGGYSTMLRPSIDRTGLPPLAPRSPLQEVPLSRPPGSSSPEPLLGLPGAGWALGTQRLVA